MSRELFICLTNLDIRDLSLAFSNTKLINLTQFYSTQFYFLEVKEPLNNKLEDYIKNICCSEQFSDLDEIGNL